ncbi:MAG: glycerol kinase GlpK [Flavobacteriales bacterium]
MSEKKYILAIDQGTTSSRAIIFDKHLKAVGSAQEEFNQYFPRAGYVEQEPEEIWQSVVNVVSQAMYNARITKDEVICLGITNQRETTILWDKTNSKPVHRAIVWQSRQSASICEQWKSAGWEHLIKDKTGLVIDAYFSASKIKWIFDKFPELEAKAYKGEIAFGTVDSWLIWKLTNGAVHASDVSNASRTMLMNLKSCQWDSELLHMFQIPQQMLPEIKLNTDHFGICKIAGLEGIPIMGVAGDQQSALFGQLCFESGQAKNTYGTGCFMLMNTGDQIIQSQFGLLSTVAWKTNHQTCYALEGSVFAAGSAIQWLRDSLGIINHSNETEAIATSIDDSDGVFFVPALTGLGTPYWKSEAKGIISGLSRGTGKAHIVRAALESMAFQSAEVFDIMQRESGLSLQSLGVDGGASDNNFVMQFQSDLLQCEVIRPVNRETTAIGAAMMAGMASGVWKDLKELKNLVQTDRVFRPQLSKSLVDSKLKQWKTAVNQCMFGL